MGRQIPRRGGQVGRGGGRGRGGGGGGRGGGGGGGGGAKSNINVAKPILRDLPNELHIQNKGLTMPKIITQSFPEFKKAQPFFSILEKLQPEFSASSERYDRCWLGLPDSAIVSIEKHDSDSTFLSTLLCTDGQSIPIFVKRIHLLDPINAMQGDYVCPEDGGLPAPSDLWKSALSKINEPMNEAYIDALFAICASRMVENNISPHWCKCYGTFSARVDKYLFNISEEYASLRVKPWWHRNQRIGLFTVPIDTDTPRPVFSETGNDLVASDFELVETSENTSIPINTIIEVVDPETTNNSAPIQLTAPKLRLRRITPESNTSSGSSGNSDDTDDEEEEQFAEFSNFPVQVTLLERAIGTLEDMLDTEENDNATDMSTLDTKEERWSAWLFQIIAALHTAQYYYGFVHNDLHTNNIMYVPTDLTHLTYRVHKGTTVSYMHIPTFGKILKIIDFGRATFTLPEPGGFFISDAFFPGNDAATQYNCMPFYDADEGKKVEPNTSFDLCRLAVSLIESLYPERPLAAIPTAIMSREGPKLYTETVSSVYNLMWEWLQDDNGKNVLRQPNGEERYPDFDLYRCLASDVHKAIPSKQIEKPLFARFKIQVVPSSGTIYDLHL